MPAVTRDDRVSAGRGGKPEAHQPSPPPKALPGFPDAVRVVPKSSPGHRPRPRWREPDGTIYEWDRLHGAVEKYNSRGDHQGEFSADGKQLKPANPSYKAVP